MLGKDRRESDINHTPRCSLLDWNPTLHVVEGSRRGDVAMPSLLESDNYRIELVHMGRHSEPAQGSKEADKNTATECIHENYVDTQSNVHQRVEMEAEINQSRVTRDVARNCTIKMRKLYWC